MINDSLNKEEFEAFPVVGITMSIIFSGDEGITVLGKEDGVGDTEFEGDGKYNSSSTRMNLLAVVVVVGILKVEENPYFLYYIIFV